MNNGVLFLLGAIGYLIIGLIISFIYSKIQKANDSWDLEDDPELCVYLVFAWPFAAVLWGIMAIVETISMWLRGRR